MVREIRRDELEQLLQLYTYLHEDSVPDREGRLQQPRQDRVYSEALIRVLTFQYFKKSFKMFFVVSLAMVNDRE